MRRLMNAMGQYFQRVPDQVRKRTLGVWLLFLAGTVFMAAGIGRATFDTSIEGWFAEDEPLIVAFDWFHHDFGSDDHLYVVYEPKDDDVFSEKSLTTLLRLQQELEGRVAQLREGDDSALKHVVKITSLINAPVLRAEDDALISRRLVGDSVPSAPEDLDRIRPIAESQKSFPLLYFSKDYRYGGILIETNFGAIPLEPPTSGEILAVDELRFDAPPADAGAEERPKFKPTDLADYIALMDEVKAVLSKPEYASHFDYHPVGSTATAEYNLAMVSELGLLNLAALAIIMVLLWFMFRSLSAVVWPIIIVVSSVIWTVGITAWLGLPITSFVMVTVMLTLAIGVADTVHVISAYLSSRNEGHDHATALRRGFRHVAVACLLTTVTNIAAVLALAITTIVPIKVFAFMCALGVGLPFLFSVYLLPLMLDLWAPKASGSKGKGRVGGIISRLLPNVSTVIARLLERVLPMVERRPVAIIVLFMSVFAVSIYGATQTKVDTDPVGSFPEDSKIRESVRVVDSNMMGAQSAEIYLDLGKVNAFHDPFVLNAMDKLQDTIERKYADVVVRTTSLVETVKHSYQTLNGDREDRYVIPETQSAVSQTLFLFNLSNPDDRRKLVSDNYDRARISVRLYNRGSYEYTRTWDAMRSDIESSVAEIRSKYPAASVAITGMLPLMMQGADYLTRDQLTSFALALVLVSAILLLIFGSLKAGVIALVPNLIPAMLAYGALGLLGRPLDITTMMIAPIIIGIAVDDTVHFVSRYRNEVAIDGDIRRALQATIREAGQAVVFTSLIIGLGFGVMAFASDAGAANLGMIGSMAIFVALFNDLFLLPALILAFKLKGEGESASQLSPIEPKLSSDGLA